MRQFVFFHSVLFYFSPGSLWFSTRFTLNSPGRWVACWVVLLSQYAFINMGCLSVGYCASSTNLKKTPTILSWNQLFKQDSKTSFYPPCLKGDFQQLYLYIAEEAVSFVSLCSHHLCPVQALSRMGGLWRKLHTVWVNVGGLHAGVFLLKRTANTFGQTPEDVYESRGADNAQEEKELS